MNGESLANGRYTVQRTLGGGGMAVVYLARDEELDRAVAVKVLADHALGDDAFRERFVREARMAAQLSHPNIVTVYDTGDADGRPFIVMEYVEGETLAALLAREKRLAPTEVVDLALQVCAGLDHAHQAGLVHRDVKPQNLLRRADDGIVKIADFGIARSSGATQLTQTGTILGTAAYLAPEQAAGEDVSPATDLYALGSVLYELLTGRPPYRFDSLVELAVKQREAPVTRVRELAPEVPADVEAAVMRCLEQDPAARPGSAAALARALGETSTEPHTEPLSQPTAVMRGRRRSLMPRRADRRLWLALAAAAAVIAIVSGLALASRDDGGGEPPASPEVQQVDPGSSPADRARNLADWLRDNSE